MEKKYKRHVDQIRAFTKKSEDGEETRKKSKSVTFFEDKIDTDLSTLSTPSTRRRTRFYKNNVSSRFTSSQQEVNTDVDTPSYQAPSTYQTVPLNTDEVIPSYQAPSTSQTVPVEISTTTMEAQPLTSHAEQRIILLPQGQGQSIVIPNTPPIRRSSRLRKVRSIYSPSR